MSVTIQRIVSESYLPVPTDSPDQGLDTLWAYAGVSLRDQRRMLSPQAAECPRVSDILAWMETLDINTVGAALLFGVTRPTISARYLSDDPDHRVVMGTRKMLRAALLTGFYRHHPHAPLYSAAMTLLDNLISSGEIDNIFRPLIHARRDQPNDLDRIRDGVVAMLRPAEVTETSYPSYVQWCNTRGIKYPMGASREPYELVPRELPNVKGDYVRQFFYKRDFSNCTLSGEFAEAVFLECQFDGAVLSGNFTGAELLSCTGAGVTLSGDFDFALFTSVLWDVSAVTGTFRNARLRRTMFANVDGMEIDVRQFAGCEGLASYVDARLPNVSTIEGRTTLQSWTESFPEARLWAQTCTEGQPMGDALHDRYF